MELKKGTTLHGGMYTIEKTLGRGSFGITYLATAKIPTESGLGKMEVIAKVAIKEFFMSDVNARKEDGSTVEGSSGSVFTNYRRKFRKEAENLAKLLHPNIVHVFDVFDENGTSYYAMEFLDGGNLDDYIMSQGKLPEKRSLEIVRTIGSALSYMHSKKMLHLDMKPKNVMYSSHVSLIDFGLSKQYTEDGEPESSTTIGLGTPGYAPVEQSSYRPDGTFPATLDVYALGATMFKMLTGQRPPDASVLLNEGFPTKGFEGVSAQTVSAVKKAMNPVRKNRFQSVDEFMAALPKVAPVEAKDEEKTYARKIFEPDADAPADEIEVVDFKPEKDTELPTLRIPSNPNPKEHDLDNNLAAPHTLKSVWKSNKAITNWINVIALLAFMVFWVNIGFSILDLNITTYQSDNEIIEAIVVIILILSPYLGMYKIIQMMYGQYRGWKTPLIVYGVLTLITTLLVYTYEPLSADALILISGLFISYLICVIFNRPKKKMSFIETDEYNLTFDAWNNVSRLTMTGLSIIVIVSIVILMICSYDEIFHHAYLGYPDRSYFESFTLNELSMVAFCLYIIAQKRLIGIYLFIPFLVFLAPPGITLHSSTGEAFLSKIWICCALSFVVLLIAFSIKMKGKNTFAILK